MKFIYWLYTLNPSLSFWIVDEDKEFSHRFYFGEDQSRYLLEIRPENFDQLKQLSESKNVVFEKLGVVDQAIIKINNLNEIKVSELRNNFEQGVGNIWF